MYEVGPVANENALGNVIYCKYSFSSSPIYRLDKSLLFTTEKKDVTRCEVGWIWRLIRQRNTLVTSLIWRNEMARFTETFFHKSNRFFLTFPFFDYRSSWGYQSKCIFVSRSGFSTSYKFNVNVFVDVIHFAAHPNVRGLVIPHNVISFLNFYFNCCIHR